MKSDLSLAIACQSIRLDGGMGRYILDLIEGLNCLGIHPTIFTKKIDPSVCQNLQFESVVINCKPFPTKLRDYYFNFRLDSLMKHQKFDAILSTNRYPGATISFCGGTHIGYLRGIGKTPSFFDKKMIALESKCYQQSQLVIAHSEGMSREICDLYGISKEKVQTVYPPIDGTRFTADPAPAAEIQAFRDEFGVPTDHTVFLIPSAGSQYVKGMDILQRFFSSTSLPVTLLVAGRPVEEVKNVKYIGFRKDMERTYKLVDYTILASRYEAFGLVAVESVFSGTPVVLTPNVYSNEVIAADGKILLDTSSDSSITIAIQKAIMNKHRLSNAAQLVSPQYTPYEHAKRVLTAAHLI